MKLSKKIITLILICIMAVSQSISAFADIQFRVHIPEDRTTTPTTSEYRKYVKGKVEINTLAFLTVGCWMNYNIRGSKTYSTPLQSHEHQSLTNIYSQEFYVANGAVNDGKIYTSAGTEGYYRLNGTITRTYMGYQSKILS